MLTSTNSTYSAFIQTNPKKKTRPFLVVYLRSRVDISCWCLSFQKFEKSLEGMTKKNFLPMASFQVSPLNPQNDSEIPLGTSFLGAQGILAIRTFKIHNLTDTKAHFFIRRKQNRWKVIHCNKNGMFSPSKTNRGFFLLPGLPFCACFSCYSPGLFRWIWAKSRDFFWSKID